VARWCIGTWSLVAIICFMVVGGVFGGFALFRTYGHAFSRLAARDIQISQQLYNDSVARELKDMLLQQQDDLLNIEIPAEAATREAGFLALYWAILNETAARIAEEAPLFSGIANETAARILIDNFFAAEISNLTSSVVEAESYEAYSKSTFLAIIANITHLQLVLSNEIAARIAGDALLTEQGAISDAAIAYLTTTLEHDIHDRYVQGVLINEWIAALDAIGKGIESINGQTGSINNNVNIVSTNVLTTITVPSPGQMIFTNNALLTIDGVSPNAGGNIALTVGAGLTIAPDGPHGFILGSTYMPIGPNEVTLTGTRLTPMSFPGPQDTPFTSVGCIFPAYNGGFCGWSAPDRNTYIIHVSATLTMCVTNDGGNPTSVHLNMGLARTTYTAAEANRLCITENTGGQVDVVDGSFIGSALLSLSNAYCMDMGFTATTVMEGAGVSGGDGGVTTGYGVFVYFNGYIQNIGTAAAEPITVTYHVTKVS
jgi:hypothetical protein